MDIKKRKRILLRPHSLTNFFCFCFYSSSAVTFRLRSVLAFLLLLLATSLFITSRHYFPRPEPSSSFSFSFRRRATALSLLSNSLQDIYLSSSTRSPLPELRILNLVSFPDHLLILLSNSHKISNNHSNFNVDASSSELHCVYRYVRSFNRSSGNRQAGKSGLAFHPVLSTDEYDDFRWMVRCPLPPANYSAAEVGLQWNRGRLTQSNKVVAGDGKLSRWDWVVYEAAVDGNEAVVALVKGLNLRRDGEPNPTRFRCHFLSDEKSVRNRSLGPDSTLVATSIATSVAQEVVRCPLPEEVKTRLLANKDEEIFRVSIDSSSVRSTFSPQRRQILPSVARLYSSSTTTTTTNQLDDLQQRIRNRGVIVKNNHNSSKFDLCGCTMTWNQASWIREWVIYHAWLGVQRWFIYDNNSDDELQSEIDELDSENYNVTRHVWPWIKTQEAGFSHCVLRAKAECKWVAFFDVDEFYYFPKLQKDGISGQNSLRTMVMDSLFENAINSTSLDQIGEIRTRCHSFGPSGLSKPPARGVTVGYTCRLLLPERHKSIVRPEAVDDSLGNVVHHFKLKDGYRFLDWPEGRVVINHYKYQVWEVFKTKFFRRVSTYVADWRESQNVGSRDRAPGLGTEAVEPVNWRLRFCEIWDNGLRDFVVANLGDSITGLLPWESEEMGKEQLNDHRRS